MVNKLHTKVQLSSDKETYEVWTSPDRITWKMVKWGLTLEQVAPIQEEIILQNHLNLLNDILKGRPSQKGSGDETLLGLI